jgi:N-acetylmuramic acid 6-phosphate etherase
MADIIDLSGLQTEGINPKTGKIDQVSTLRMCQIINDEDKEVALTVTPFLRTIAAAIDALTPRVRRGGRLIYVGAGTSGRSVPFQTLSGPLTYLWYKWCDK